MGFGQKLAVGGLLSILGGIVGAGVFQPAYDSTKPSVSLTGRLSFYDPKTGYSRFMMPDKDEVGLFLGDLCVGSTSSGMADWSHYTGLKINQEYFDQLLSNSKNIYTKVFNSQTQTLWDAKIMGTRLDNYALDVQAFRDTGIPEPASVALFSLGALVALRKKK